MPFCHLWLPQGITNHTPSIFHDIPIIFHAIPIISLWHSTIIIVVYEFNEKKIVNLSHFNLPLFWFPIINMCSVFSGQSHWSLHQNPIFAMFFPCFSHVFPCFSIFFPCFSHENPTFSHGKPPQTSAAPGVASLPNRPRRRPPPWSRPPLRRAASIWAER